MPESEVRIVVEDEDGSKASFASSDPMKAAEAAARYQQARKRLAEEAAASTRSLGSAAPQAAITSFNPANAHAATAEGRLAALLENAKKTGKLVRLPEAIETWAGRAVRVRDEDYASTRERALIAIHNWIRQNKAELEETRLEGKRDTYLRIVTKEAATSQS